MIRYLIHLSFFALLSNCAGGADFYLSPDGNDQWSGTLASPNAEKSDGPFATLQQARNAVRELKKDSPAKDLVVQIRGGDYRLIETVRFGLEDSGAGEATITYENYPEESPLFHSDRLITDWKLLADPPSELPAAARGKVWVAHLPQQKDQATKRFYTLYDEQGRLPRARSQGFIPLNSKKSSKERLVFPEGRLRQWDNLPDVELLVRPNHAWILNILPLSSVDEKRGIATTTLPATYGMSPLHYLKETESAWVENVLEALDEPGEWVLNTQKGLLYLWPRQEGEPQGVRSPLLQEYLLVEGHIDKAGPEDQPVRNLIFRGLTFTRGESYRFTSEAKGLQHDWDLHDTANALVRLRGAQNCVVEDCHFLQSGGSALRVDLHGQTIRIEGNHIEQIGAAGILLCGYGPGTKDLNHHNLVSNNHIHHVGQIYAHSPAIFLWQSGENQVTHNLIHHTPYSGLIISGVMTDFFSRGGNGRELVRTIRRDEVGPQSKKSTWENVRPFLHTHDNLIEFNEIHHAMEQLNDGNGIYIRGAGGGNIIRRNYIHDLVSPTVMQSAIRTDGGQRDTLITENVVYRCTAQGMQIKLNNRAVNNIIADIRPGIHKGKKEKPVYFKLYEGPLTGGAYQKNILYHLAPEAPLFYQEVSNFRTKHGAFAKDAATDFNLYYSKERPQLSQATLTKKQDEGVDQHSLSADPLFRDPDQGDFRFREGSPATQLGITPLDLSQVGLLRKTAQSRN